MHRTTLIWPLKYSGSIHKLRSPHDQNEIWLWSAVQKHIPVPDQDGSCGAHVLCSVWVWEERSCCRTWPCSAWGCWAPTGLHQHSSASGEEGLAASCTAPGEGAAQSCPQAQPPLVTTMALITPWHRRGLSLIPHSDPGETLEVCLNTLSGQ